MTVVWVSFPWRPTSAVKLALNSLRLWVCFRALGAPSHLLTLALVARVLDDEAFLIARRCRFEVRLARPALLRVDFRDGLPVAESSRRAPPFLSARFDAFRVPLLPEPARRSVALTPGREVSTNSSRLRRRGDFGLGGRASRCCCALKAWALVDTRAA